MGAARFGRKAASFAGDHSRDIRSACYRTIMQDRKEVVIIGAGVVGLCTAFYCARRGLKVTVLDRAPRQRDGCSFGNAGMIVPSHFIPLAAPGMITLGLKWMLNPESPFYIQPRLNAGLMKWGLAFCRAATASRVNHAAPVLRDFSLLSRQCYEQLPLDLGLVKKGLLMLCKESHTLEEEAQTAKKAEELGIPALVLNASETAALDPDVTMDVIGSVFFPMDCHLSPARLMQMLEDELDRAGVERLYDCSVEHWHSQPHGQGSKITALETTQGRLQADEFVVAAGIWSEGLTKRLRLNLPMQAGKGYSLTLSKPRQLPQLCSICTEARLAVTPMDGFLRVGGTMELAGIDTSVNHRRVRGIVRSFPQYFPEFKESDFEGIEPWSGLRPVPPDGLPYLGRTSHWSNLILATGHAMMGLSLAPGTGKTVADIITGEKPAVDLTLFSPDRF